jgi:hypothetical protein
MFNLHYVSDRKLYAKFKGIPLSAAPQEGEIVSYQEGPKDSEHNEEPAGCSVLSYPQVINIFDQNFNVIMMVENGKLVPKMQPV